MVAKTSKSRFYLPDFNAFFRKLAILIDGRDAKPNINYVEEGNKK